MKFYLFGKDVGDPEVIILNQGEKVADLKPRGTEVVESPSFTATVTEGKPSADKRPKDKGTKFSGYGVQVFDAEQKLVGENFSLPSLKDKVGNKQRPAQ